MKKHLKPLLIAALAINCYSAIAQTTWSTTLNSGTNLKLGTSNTAPLTFYTGNVERMSLNAEGGLKLNALANPATTETHLVYVDASGNFRALPGTGNPSVPGIPCVPSALPWMMGGNNTPPNNTIGTCSFDPFILKSFNQQAVFLTPSAYTGVGLNNSSPLTTLDISDGNILGNTDHMLIYGDPTGRIEATSGMNLVANTNLNASAVNDIDLLFNNSGTWNNNTNFTIYASSKTPGNELFRVSENSLVTAYGSMGVGGGLTVGAGASIGANLSVGTAASVATNLSVGTSASIGTNLSVTGNASVNGNANVMGNVGIGIANPSCKLDVRENGPVTANIYSTATPSQPAKLWLINQTYSYSFGIDNSGTGHIGSNINLTNQLNLINFKTDPSNMPLVWIGEVSGAPNNAEFNINSAGNPNALDVYNSASGKVEFRVKNTGFVYAREINVQVANYPDYVFKTGYKLMPLEEVEQYIKQHKHLPNVPAAAEIEKDGASLGELNRIQMEKIEELTLYVIELKKEVEALKARTH
jgi:hypothetical protein